MFGNLNHIAIYVKNRREAIDFYTKVLGAKLQFTVDNESDGLLIAMMRLNDFDLELLEPPDDKDGVVAAAMATLNHMAIDVDDIDQAVEYIRELGIAVEPPGIYDVPNFGREGHNLRVAFFHGPSGERIELFQAIDA